MSEAATCRADALWPMEPGARSIDTSTERIDMPLPGRRLDPRCCCPSYGTALARDRPSYIGIPGSIDTFSASPRSCLSLRPCPYCRSICLARTPSMSVTPAAPCEPPCALTLPDGCNAIGIRSCPSEDKPASRRATSRAAAIGVRESVGAGDTAGATTSGASRLPASCASWNSQCSSLPMKPCASSATKPATGATSVRMTAARATTLASCVLTAREGCKAARPCNPCAAIFARRASFVVIPGVLSAFKGDAATVLWTSCTASATGPYESAAGNALSGSWTSSAFATRSNTARASGGACSGSSPGCGGEPAATRRAITNPPLHPPACAPSRPATRRSIASANPACRACTAMPSPRRCAPRAPPISAAAACRSQMARPSERASESDALTSSLPGAPDRSPRTQSRNWPRAARAPST